MNRFPIVLLLGLIASASDTVAQNLSPTVSKTLPNLTIYTNGPTRSIDLTDFFRDQDLTPAIRMTTVFGPIDVALYQRQKPITANNFLRYVDNGKYFMTDATTKLQASSFIHRSVPGFVIQGGGFIGTVNSANTAIQPTAVAPYAAIQNEPGISNKRGTIAMAKLGTDANSATSQWFINLADNGTNLDAQNGGFAVFGSVINGGMDIADRIANLPTYNFGSAFDTLPLRDYDGASAVKVPNLVSLPQISRIDSVSTPLNFSAATNNIAALGVAVRGTKLRIDGLHAGSGTVTVTATDLDGATVSQAFNVDVIAAPGRLVNISTRLQVRTGDEVLIGGFIVVGDLPKRLLVRAIGPSLGTQGISDPLLDPQLELYDSSNTLIATSDNWADANKQDIVDTGIPPTAAKESAILVTLPSSATGTAYTAIVRGAGATLGTGLVEVYDLDSGPGSVLANIASRGRVGTTTERYLVGGFFVGGTGSKNVLIRALGPSLTGVAGVLADPKLELRDSNGTLIDANNDWQSSPQAPEIQASGIAPTDPKEAAALKTLSAGSYTATVSSNNNTAGVGSVEIYQLQ